MKENDRFYYELDDYNRITLVCTYVEGNIVWLKYDISDEVSFKYNIITKKLYRWVSPEWITTEYELKELDADTIWSERMFTKQTTYFGD